MDTRNSDKNINKKQDIHDLKLIEGKIGKEILNSKELSILVTGSDTNSKTIRTCIKKICESSKLLKVEDFIDQKTNEYAIRPELQGVLLTILCSMAHDKRHIKQRYTISDQRRIEDSILKEMDRFLDEKDKEVIKASPIYQSIYRDRVIDEEQSKYINGILSVASQISAVNRYQYKAWMVRELKTIYDKLSWVETESLFYPSKVLINHPEWKTDEIDTEMECAENIQELLLAYLAYKIKHGEAEMYDEQEVKIPLGIKLQYAQHTQLGLSEEELKSIVDDISKQKDVFAEYLSAWMDIIKGFKDSTTGGKVLRRDLYTLLESRIKRYIILSEGNKDLLKSIQEFDAERFAILKKFLSM